MPFNMSTSTHQTSLPLQASTMMTCPSGLTMLNTSMSPLYPSKLTSSTHLCKHRHPHVMSCSPANTTVIDALLTSAQPKHFFCNAHPIRFLRKPLLLKPFSMRLNRGDDAIVSHVVLSRTWRSSSKPANTNQRPQRGFFNPDTTIKRQQPCIE